MVVPTTSSSLCGSWEQSIPSHDQPLETIDPARVHATAICEPDTSSVLFRKKRGRPIKTKDALLELEPGDAISVPNNENGKVQDQSVKPVIDISKKSSKRRRSILSEGCLDPSAKAALADRFRSEIRMLIDFFHEDDKFQLEWKSTCGRSRIACLIQESNLSFSKLITELLQQLNSSAPDRSYSVTPASLRSIVLSIGERISFGVSKPDADVLEDDSETCLWCWEVRDMKLLPEHQRGPISVRRRKRRKISERLVALSDVVSALTSNFDDAEKEHAFLSKAEEALLKTDDMDAIRSALSLMIQKRAVKDLHNETKSKEKEILKEQHRLEREKEKERRRLDKLEEKKKVQQEKEKGRLAKEAQKEALRQEKTLKRQQEETEKETKKEKEAPNLRKQAALQKQCTLMDCFLHISKDRTVDVLENDSAYGNQDSKCGLAAEEIVLEIDQEMCNCQKDIDTLLSSHVEAWRKHKIGNIRRWGVRWFPKLPGISELRLQGATLDGSNALLKTSVSQSSDDEDHELEEVHMILFTNEPSVDSRSNPEIKLLRLQCKQRKLLQFDKSHRPAYYGSFSKTSVVVRPQNPLKSDPSLDYEIDSDEEWEEEEPGESLSDCDKDDEDEKMDAEEDDENADGFVVPDGYLSDSEVAQLDQVGTEFESDGEALFEDFSIRISKNDGGNESKQNLLANFGRQRKLLEQITDRALKFNRPFIICNFKQAMDDSTPSKTELLCLEALRMCPLASNVIIEAPPPPSPSIPAAAGDEHKENTNETLSCRKPKVRKALLPALSEMVSVLIACPRGGFKKTIDILSSKFPSASRIQLLEKVKEICDFADNHWQVKNEVLEKLGITTNQSPLQLQLHQQRVAAVNSTNLTENDHKAAAALHNHPKPITKFFSKRCLPPEMAGPPVSSPPFVKRPNIDISPIEKENSPPLHTQPA